MTHNQTRVSDRYLITPTNQEQPLNPLFRKEITFSPAFDKRDPDPTKSYGIGSVQIRFVLHGPNNVVQFCCSTGWYLPHVRAELDNKPRLSSFDLDNPMGTDVGYHASKPQHDFQAEQGPRDCDLLPGKKCFYDGTSLGAVEVMKMLINGGSDAVWKYLEDFYRSRFSDDLLVQPPTQV